MGETGPAEFKQLLLTEREQVLRSLAGKLLTYATGAGIRFSDRPEVERLTRAVADSDFGLRTLVHAVVQSDLFRSK